MTSSSPSLAQRFSRGVAWFYMVRLSSRLTSLLQTVVVARLLAPTDFGVMGIALLVISLLEMLATTGYDQALVQKRERKISQYLDTAWTVSMVRGFVLGGTIYASAPLAARFFQEARAVPVLRLMALSPALTGFASPGLTALNKELHFRKLALFDAARAILGTVTAIGAAALLRSVWALPAALLVGNAAFSLGSYLVHPYRPGSGFQWKKARELWGYGRWILGSKLLHYLFNDGDDWVAGRLLGSTALGFYQTAYRVGCTPMTEITAVFSKVAFPTFAKLQEDRKTLRRAYLRVLQVIMFASTPLAAGFLLVARDTVAIFLGPKWLPMVGSLQILLCWGWMRSFRATTGPVLLATGHPQLITKVTGFKVAILAALIAPLSLRFGIVGTSWAVVIASAIEIPLLVHCLRIAVQAEAMHTVERLVRPLLPGGAMAGLVLCLQQLLSGATPPVRLGASMACGASAYVVAMVMLDRHLQWGLRADVFQAVGHSAKPVVRVLRSAVGRGLPASRK